MIKYYNINTNQMKRQSMSEKTEEEPTERKEKVADKKEKTSPFQMRIPNGLLEFFKEEALKVDVSLNNYMLFMMIKHRKEYDK